MKFDWQWCEHHLGEWAIIICLIIPVLSSFSWTWILIIIIPRQDSHIHLFLLWLSSALIRLFSQFVFFDFVFFFKSPSGWYLLANKPDSSSPLTVLFHFWASVATKNPDVNSCHITLQGLNNWQVIFSCYIECLNPADVPGIFLIWQ